jgi:methionyl-tRNA formyltransferase
MTNMRFGFLSTVDAPLLPYFLWHALTQNVDDIVVICDEKTVSDKDKKIWQERTGGRFCLENGCEVTLYSFKKNIPFYFVSSHNDAHTLDLMQALGVDCLLNAGTPRRLSSEIIAATPVGVVNIHPGVLPDYRGCSCVEWAIYNDAKVGNSAHFMDAGYDTGPVIAVEDYIFPYNATYQDIRSRVFREGCRLAGEVLRDLNAGKIDAGVAVRQAEGRRHKPMPDELFREVLQKTKDGRYPHCADESETFPPEKSPLRA